MMRKLLPLLLLAFTAHAQTYHAVSVAGSGSHSGADWNNSFIKLPGTLVRGDVYCLADGNYGALTVSSASGSGWIEIRKAQSYDANCAGLAGWNTGTMGSSQAIFTRTNSAIGISITIDQVFFNGNGLASVSASMPGGAGCGGGPSDATDVTKPPVTPADCGIKAVNSCTNVTTNGCDAIINLSGSADNVKFLYMEWQGLGNAQYEQYPVRSQVANDNSATRLFQHIFQHDFGANILYAFGHRQVDHSYFWGNQRIQFVSNHGQYSYDGFLSAITGFTEFNNVYRDIQGTAIWGIEDGPQVASNVVLYNNFIISTSPPESWMTLGINNGTVACLNGSTCNNFVYVNNTHVNTWGARIIPSYQDTGTTTSGWTIQNNLWYQMVNSGGPINLPNGTESNNSFLNSGAGICRGGTADVCTQVSGNPFVNIANFNFTLALDAANWNNRFALGSPYNVDAVGNTYTTDRGAYQFISGGTAIAPTCTPGTGSYTSIQFPVCTNPNGGTTVQCYTTNGTTPATNLLGTGCTTGIALASGGSVTINVTTTLKIIAGVAGFSDSSVNSYTYTISYTMTVTVYGSGSVSSSPAGINACTAVGGTCSASFASGATVVLTATPAAGSSFTGWAFPGCGVTGTCTPSLTDNDLVSAIFNTTFPQLPQAWVNSNEGNTAFTYELVLGASSWAIGPPPTCTFALPYATTFAGLQSAINAIEACRTLLGSGAGTGIALDIPPGTYQSTTANGLVIPQSGAGLANVGSFLILRSTQMASLPIGQTVCSHGIQDNIITSTDIGLDNPDCTGTNMYYQTLPAIGTTVSGLTQLSVNSTTLTAITSTGVQCVNLTNGFASVGISVTVDTAGNAENVNTVNGINEQTGICGNFTKTHVLGTPVTYNVGTITLANGIVTNTSAYNDASHMWKVVALAGGTGNAVSFCNASASVIAPMCSSNFGPDHWLIQGMEATLSPGSKEAGYVLQMQGTTIDSTVAQLSTHIHIQRSWLHGDWTSTLVGANNVAGGCDLEGVYVSLMDSQISQILRPGAESHPCTVQANTFKGVHNWFDSGSQGFFPGGYSGGSGPSLPIGFVPGQDWEIRRNMISYPFSWLSQSPILGGQNPNYPTNFSLVKKNGQEDKVGARVLIRGNIIPDVDNAGAQSGVMQEMNPRNNSAGLGTYYPAFVHDFTVQSNIFRHGCALINISTSNAGPGGGVAFPPRNLWVNNNLFYDIEINNFANACVSVAGYQLNSGGGTWQGTVTQTDSFHEQIIANCNNNSGDCIGQITAVSVSGGTCGGSPTLTFPTPDLVGGNQARATVKCTGTAFQTPVITNFGSGYTATPVVTLTCPSCTGSQTVVATRNSSSSGVATDTGFQVFNISAGDPVAITDCQNPAFNTVPSTLHSSTYVPSAIGPPASGPSAAWTGSFASAAVTVTAPHTGTPGAVENGGYCKVTTLQGAPYHIHRNHNTVVSDSTHVVNSSQAFDNSETDGPQFQILSVDQDDLYTNGDIGSSAVGSGTVAEQFWFDALNTMTLDHSAFTGQAVGSYTPYGNNPIFPAASPTLYFPANSCGLGFNGTGSWLFGACTPPVPLNTTDYHFFKLNAASIYHAGGTNQASDGTDNGVNITALDVAQTENIFTCLTACGSPGPYVDSTGPGPSPPTNLTITPGVTFTPNTFIN